MPGELRGHLRQDRAGDTGGGGGDRTAAAAQRPDELRQPRPGAANLPAHELVHRRLRHRREVRRHLPEHRALGERHERERRALRPDEHVLEVELRVLRGRNRRRPRE